MKILKEKKEWIKKWKWCRERSKKQSSLSLFDRSRISRLKSRQLCSFIFSENSISTGFDSIFNRETVVLNTAQACHIFKKFAQLFIEFFWNEKKKDPDLILNFIIGYKIDLSPRVLFISNTSSFFWMILFLTIIFFLSQAKEPLDVEG